MTAARDKWVNDNWDLALRACQGSKVFPETLITQAIIETQKEVNGVYTPGESELAKVFNNYFGMVADSSWTGKTVIRSDNGNQRKFRVYSSKETSFLDYVKFLEDNNRYNKALEASTPEVQLNLIASAGYAEDPTYGALLQGVLKGLKKKAIHRQPDSD